MTTPKTLTANEWFTKYVRMPGGTLSFVEIVRRAQDEAIAATRAEYDEKLHLAEECTKAIRGMLRAEIESDYGVTPKQCKAAMELAVYFRKYFMGRFSGVADGHARRALGEDAFVEDKQE